MTLPPGPWPAALSLALQDAVVMAAILTTGLFAGAAANISLAEHPARMACSLEVAVAQFAPSYYRAATAQVLYLLIATLTSLLSLYWQAVSVWWWLPTLLIFFPFPLTMVWLMPINRQLLKKDRSRDPQVLKTLLTRWGQWHAMRTLCSLSSFVLMLYLRLRGL
jgi:hypothetical protein